MLAYCDNLSLLFMVIIIDDGCDDCGELPVYITTCNGRGRGEGPFQKPR
jgi:hypothetical protein